MGMETTTTERERASISRETSRQIAAQRLSRAAHPAMRPFGAPEFNQWQRGAYFAELRRASCDVCFVWAAHAAHAASEGD